MLYFQLGNAESADAQLGHLLSVGALPAVSLGIIPMATRERALWPQETFHVLRARRALDHPSHSAPILRGSRQPATAPGSQSFRTP